MSDFPKQENKQKQETGRGLDAPSCSPFSLGDSVVVMGFNSLGCFRELKVEGTVTARGHNCVRIRFRSRLLGLSRQKWFSVNHYDYNVVKTEYL